jgi:hypothetical protein
MAGEQTFEVESTPAPLILEADPVAARSEPWALSAGTFDRGFKSRLEHRFLSLSSLRFWRRWTTTWSCTVCRKLIRKLSTRGQGPGI